MAQWNHAEQTLDAKLVYYGPAFGGKTTTLEALHGISDADCANDLISIDTADGLTLFFDLLPLDLAGILGYKLAMKLYTVPGQVRYDTTRQVVLEGADALVFVADSSSSRKDQNVWSLQNLRMNMRAKGLDPERIPVVFQLNKQDVPDAAPLDEVASWVGISSGNGFASVASESRGVLEPLIAACRAMIEGIVETADAETRERIDVSGLDEQIDRAFAPWIERLDRGGSICREAGSHARESIVFGAEDLLASAVRTSVELGERLSARSARSRQLEATIARREEELFKARAELKSLDETKSRFLAGLTHELHSPLTAILGAAHGICGYRSNAQERKELAETIVHSAGTLQSRLESMFRLVELGKQSRPLELEARSPVELVERAIELSGHDGIRLDAGPAPEVVRVDPALVVRALANLIDNAVKFSPEGSRVEVSVRCEPPEETFTISVLDRGPGVAEADRERIFGSFEQGRDAQSGKPGGTGNGLYEARALAIRHGGVIDYRPRKGGGSEFRLTVPVEPREEPAALEECIA